MKKLTLLLAAVLFTAMSTMAQVAINTDDTDANASAILDVKSISMGFLPPRMYQYQMDAITNPARGLMVYCSDCAPKGIRTYNGDYWTLASGYPANLADDDIFNPLTSKIWMDRNLGASQVATSSTDYLAYGSLYQWGRLSDGHELINWTSSTDGVPVNGSTTTLSSSDDPGNSLFIDAQGDPGDWRDPKNDDLWQGVAGINNPCPSGYRIPTDSDVATERSSWSSNNADGAFNSLKLTKAGYRRVSSFGHLPVSGERGYYWSSSVGIVNNWDARYLFFRDSNASSGSEERRAVGFSVRCIKD